MRIILLIVLALAVAGALLMARARRRRRGEVLDRDGNPFAVRGVLPTVAALVAVLEARFGQLPEDLLAAIHSVTDLPALRQGITVAATAPTLADFRRTAAL